MKVIIAAVLSIGGLYTVAELNNTLVPLASESAAFAQGLAVSNDAFIASEFGTLSWEDGLQSAVDNARHNEGQLTLDGTTVRWDNGADVWCIALPHYNATVEPVRCNA